MDDLEQDDRRARAEEQALEEDEEDDDDVPDAPMPKWNRHGSGGLVVSDGHDSWWEYG